MAIDTSYRPGCDDSTAVCICGQCCAWPCTPVSPPQATRCESWRGKRTAAAPALQQTAKTPADTQLGTRHVPRAVGVSLPSRRANRRCVRRFVALSLPASSNASALARFPPCNRGITEIRRSSATQSHRVILPKHMLSLCPW
jgi:hypothetical protein